VKTSAISCIFYIKFLIKTVCADLRIVLYLLSRSRLFLFILPYIFIFAYQTIPAARRRSRARSFPPPALFAHQDFYCARLSKHQTIDKRRHVCVCLRVTALLLSSDKHVCTDDFIPENNILYFTTTTTTTTTTSADDDVISMQYSVHRKPI